MAIEKASRSTLVGQVVAQMEQMIESGQWSIGDKIPAEPQLMDMFEVSRNTLREGIQSLVHIGLLEARQGIGTTVKSNSNLGLILEKKIRKSDLLEVLEVRLGFEREAAQFACMRRTAEDLTQMEICLDDCKKASKTNDPFQFAQADIAFHKSVAIATHNKIFLELYEHITDALQNSIDRIMRIKKPVNFENEIHIDLFQAIKARNSQLVLESVNHYLNDAIETLSTMINE
ncbi:FadR/GntR family transcriptional regulator [Desulfosporosinus sp. PR]|uniref:FadR/GntR family transcriptional regulator n=1 Tax=Candidatus Desulfosporosinus nitrosoreducens TaxID=3401928 RepID=UPI0027F46810|nr:FadR/GntR family transcriptional regulator [Desulfosporosinus sp. PR]MDQ7094395.1 FadR/GntR family transcriptional regulator [Desulfosporosinus sp. PR]